MSAPLFIDTPWYASPEEARAALDAALALPPGEDREHTVAVAQAGLDAALRSEGVVLDEATRAQFNALLRGRG